MRVSFLICSSTALGLAASIAACAASGDEPATAPSPDSGESNPVMGDAGVTETGASETDSGKEIDASKCNGVGWCRTTLPDQDLVMRDIWPVGSHAFAIAESSTLGITILEWEEARGTWLYIDDHTQNASGPGTYAGTIWAPNEDEVYYGVGPGFIYHGTRSAAPATAWTWTKHRLPGDGVIGNPRYWRLNEAYPALGVWGTSRDDVYAWFANTIYHWTSVDGGAPEWVAEYVANDPAAAAERLYFVAAAGTGPDSIWFSGARQRTSSGCALLVRKTPEGYEKIADGTLTSASSPCRAKAGSLLIGGAEGWLTDIQATSPDRIIGLKGASNPVTISVDGDGYSVALAPAPTNVTPRALASLWVGPENLWLSAWGLVTRSTNDVWDGGAYQLSPIALNGAPVTESIYRVRGTSNNNLWAIGVRNALHKTTP